MLIIRVKLYTLDSNIYLIIDVLVIVDIFFKKLDSLSMKN